MWEAIAEFFGWVFGRQSVIQEQYRLDSESITTQWRELAAEFRAQFREEVEERERLEDRIGRMREEMSAENDKLKVRCNMLEMQHEECMERERSLSVRVGELESIVRSKSHDF